MTVAACVLLGGIVAPVTARADTTCAFGGPSPGFKAVRVDLPKGSDFLNIRFTTARPQRPVGDRSNWHLVQGAAVIDIATGKLVASRVGAWGMSTRRATVEADGVAPGSQSFTGPDAPFEHTLYTRIPNLPAGSYYVIVFGADGDKKTPNEWWGADVSVAGEQRCTALGDGSTFDFDQSDFTGGTQVNVFGPGYAEGVSKSFTTTRRMVFGVLDAQTELVGNAALDYTLPDGTIGHVSEQIVPFVSTGGTFNFRATYQGVFPIVTVTGVALDLP